MKTSIILSFILSASSLFAQSEAEKISSLEKRVTQLEKVLKPFIKQQNLQKTKQILVNRARTRMRKDTKLYSRNQLKKIESLYQVANKKWKSQAGKQSLETLIAKYKKANRTGCAVLYLGQMNKGDKQIAYLKQAIENFSDCYYGNGVQVGPYARFMLLWVYWRSGDKAKANKLIEELKTKYPDAINHRSNNLVDIINQQLHKK
jgi:hypothetical protein